MTVDLSYASLSLRDAVSKIIERHRDDLAPCLIVRGDNPEAVAELNQYLKTLPNTFHIKLGESSKAYFDRDFICQIDPAFNVEAYPIKLPHAILLTKICNKLIKIPETPVIVLDRCHLVNSRLLFRFLRVVNQLEGHALFLFLLPEYHVEKWIKTTDNNLKYLFKIVDKKYLIYEQ